MAGVDGPDDVLERIEGDAEVAQDLGVTASSLAIKGATAQRPCRATRSGRSRDPSPPWPPGARCPAAPEVVPDLLAEKGRVHELRHAALAVEDDLDVAQRVQEPIAHQAAAHGRERGVDRVEQRLLAPRAAGSG